jgi:hypothetical protein
MGILYAVVIARLAISAWFVITMIVVGTVIFASDDGRNDVDILGVIMRAGVAMCLVGFVFAARDTGLFGAFPLEDTNGKGRHTQVPTQQDQGLV